VSAARFLPEAEGEFLALVAFYAAARKGYGIRFQLAVEMTVALAVENPMLGAPGTRSTKRLPISGFPLSLVYRPGGRR